MPRRPARKAAISRKKLAPRRRRNAATRSKGTRVLAQGAAAVPNRAFGSRSASRAKALMGLNARLPMHLGLPRAVGPYTVIRTTQLHTSSANVNIFCPFVGDGASTPDGPVIFNVCGVEAINSSLSMNAANNTRWIGTPLAGVGVESEAVPSALTVQVMNKAALQQADGLFAMGRVNQQLHMGGDTRTWDQFKTQFLSFYSPRLLTGGKLALRGVTCNAYPLNMNEYAKFCPIFGVSSTPTSSFTWTDGETPHALSPIVFVQEAGETPVEVSFLITVEWRVRFDPFNPATASHSYHPVTPDAVWNDVVGTMSSAGHGVIDIADEVAEFGANHPILDRVATAVGIGARIAMA